MNIDTANAIDFFFPSPSLVQIYFEALANAIDANASEIEIQIDIDKFNPPKGFNVMISDNGDGFNEKNFRRFSVLLDPPDDLHKGLGRLVYLRYFETVEIDSRWGENHRSFIFTKGFEKDSPIEKTGKSAPNKTTLTFAKFLGDRIKSYDDLKPGVLKHRIIEQFLPKLLSMRLAGRPLRVRIHLRTAESNEQKDFYSGEETITLDDLPSLTSIEIKDPTLDALDGIEMQFQVKAGMGERTILTAASIDGRTIPLQLLDPASVPLNHSAIFLFSSKLFKADSSRQKMQLPENLSESEVFRVLRREIGKVLARTIPEINQKNTRTKEVFEEKFPHLLGFFEESTVGLINKDEALEIAQWKFFKAEKEILQCETLDDNAFEKSLELSSRTLTEYVLYRNLILRKLRSLNPENAEAEIHNLIGPQREQFRSSEFADGIYRNNAWLLDDKFMSFQTILSEARMDDIIKAITLAEDNIADAGRPDIAMIFSDDPANVQADAVMVELKRKSDDEKENSYAINQLLERAQKLVNYCTNLQRIWYYAVIQISEELSGRLEQFEFAPLFSKGQVYYREFPTKRKDGTIVPTPVFVLSFDTIIADAQSRNHTFLQILRSSMRALAQASSEKTKTV